MSEKNDVFFKTFGLNSFQISIKSYKFVIIPYKVSLTSKNHFSKFISNAFKKL